MEQIMTVIGDGMDGVNALCQHPSKGPFGSSQKLELRQWAGDEKGREEPSAETDGLLSANPPTEEELKLLLGARQDVNRSPPHKNSTQRDLCHENRQAERISLKLSDVWTALLKTFHSEIKKPSPFAAKRPVFFYYPWFLTVDHKQSVLSTVKHDCVHQESVQWWTGCSIHHNIVL